MKFGGSILKDAQDFRRVIDIIQQDTDEKVIVVSAILGVTDKIHEFLHGLDKGNSEPKEFIEFLYKRHSTILNELVEDKIVLEDINGRLKDLLERLERVAFGVAYTEELTPRSHDFLFSFGERLAVLLMEGGLRDRKIHAKSLESDKAGCVTNGEFGFATVNMSKTSSRLPLIVKPLLDCGKIPIITGFFGADKEGQTTIFGRGGSDYSAAVIANALDADCVELWKDVEGFFSSDPKIVVDARHISHLSYNEAAELAYFGAKILHPFAIWPLNEKGIPLWVGNVQYPDRSHGTWIRSNAVKESEVVKSVAHTHDIAVLKIHGAGLGHQPGVLSRMVTELSNSKINIKSVITSQTCIALLLNKTDLMPSYKILKALRKKVVERLEPLSDVGIIAIVGDGLNVTKGIAGRVFSAVGGEGINVEMISSGASDTAYYFIVKEENLEHAVRIIHQDLFGNGLK